MGNQRQYRITFVKGGRTRTLTYPGFTTADAERDFNTDHPDAEVMSIIEDTRSVTNTFTGTANAPVVQMGDYDGDVNFFRG